MSDVTEYKCPTCGAPMHFDINKQCMVCKYCTNKYDLDYMRDNLDEVTEEKLSDFDWVERTKYVWEPYELDKMDEVECTSCGGKILMKAFYVSAKCPYCGHNVIISSDLDGDIRVMLNGMVYAVAASKLPIVRDVLVVVNVLVVPFNV